MSVCMYVCLYMCMYVCQTITFESLNVGSSYWQRQCISREYGSSSHRKVIGSRSRSQEQESLKSVFPQCKTSIAHNSSSITDPRSIRVSSGFLLRRIEWCDRHLCHVTGSDHAQLNACIHGR